ncbi:MAG: poly(A) polymerase, partial [Pseudohongiellaceae bacterium]
HPNTRIHPSSLNPRAVEVVSRLTQEGFESYLVGGCVRDLLLDQTPKDFDVSTEARPRQIRRIFRNCRVIGRRFKLAHVTFGELIIEVATFRQNPTAETASTGDGDDTEGEEQEQEIDTDALLIVRDNVFGTAEEDSVRRDFTINALLYDVNTNEVIDYVGGFEDIENRLLRTIGEPAIRFAEDPVRMLRAIKFTARLDLNLEPTLEAALHSCSPLIENSSPARVIEEIFKLLACGHSETSLAMLLDYGLLQRLLPELADYWADHRDELLALGRAVDFVDGGKRRVSNAFLLSVLFHDPFRAQLAAQEGTDPMVVMSDLVAPAALRTSIPRRDVAHMKHMLVTQLRLERNRRGRRFRMAEFLERPSTHEAIDLLYVRCLAGAVDADRHAEWALKVARQLGDKARPESDEKPAAKRPSRRRRSRSRGGRSGQGRRPRQDNDGDRGDDAGGGQSSDSPRESGNRHRDRASEPRVESPSGTQAATPSAVEEQPTVSAASSAQPPAQAPSESPSGKGRRGIKGLVRSLFRKVFDSGEPAKTEAPPVQGTLFPEPSPASSGSAAPAAEADASQGETDPTDATGSASDNDRDNSDGSQPPRKRRRRRRRSGGSGSSGTDQGGSESAASTEASSDADSGQASESSNSPSQEDGENRPARKRRRRSRGGRGRGQRNKTEGSGEQGGDKQESNKQDGDKQDGDKQDSEKQSSSNRSSSSTSGNSSSRSKSRQSGQGSKSKSRNSRSRSSSDRDRQGNRQNTSPKEKEVEDLSGSQRHPEDIEDTFDW